MTDLNRLWQDFLNCAGVSVFGIGIALLALYALLCVVAVLTVERHPNRAVMSTIENHKIETSSLTPATKYALPLPHNFPSVIFGMWP